MPEKGRQLSGLGIIAKLATVLEGRAAEFRGCQPSVRKMQPRSYAPPARLRTWRIATRRVAPVTASRRPNYDLRFSVQA
jgi:hypothetical protein